MRRVTIAWLMDTVAQVREKIDVTALISEFIPVKRAGRNFNALCPFHNEKSPSFVISPERQIWHCFGCGKGGDCFTFLMEYERLEFVEALRILAKKANIELNESSFDKNITSQKDKLYKINRLAAEFYHYVLTKHNVGKKALGYLENDRKINAGVINTFFLGYSPLSGQALCNYLLQKKKYLKDDIIAAGLGYERNGRMVDFFINRLMFPLTDHRGNIIGFSGRVMDAEVKISKYVNTRETLIYHKGNVFFGLDTAKDEIKKEGKAIVVEGEFDVISSFQNGIKNVVAIKGTALTEAQVALLARFAQKVALCLDQDSAGQEAIKRSLVLLEKKGMTTSVIVPPGGKDADEALKTDPYAFKKAVQHDVGIYDYLLDRALNRFDKKTADGKKKISEELLNFFSSIENEIVKEHYLRRLSTELDTSYESIVRQEEKISKKEISVVPTASGFKEKRKREEILEEYLVALCVQNENPALLMREISPVLEGFTFTAQSYQKILSVLNEFATENSKFDHMEFGKKLPTELVAAFDTCFLLPTPNFQNGTEEIDEVKKVAQELRTTYIRLHIKNIGTQIKEKEKSGDDAEVEGLQRELDHYASMLRGSPTTN